MRCQISVIARQFSDASETNASRPPQFATADHFGFSDYWNFFFLWRVFFGVRYFENETGKHRYDGVAAVCFAVMLIGFLNAWRMERRNARWHRQMTEAPPPDE